MNDKINLAAKLALLESPYEPGIVGFLNDYKLQVVKVKGPFVWRKHDETDDFFLVISGRLTIHLRDRDIELEPGEIFVVPRGVEHCPDAQEATEVLLIGICVIDSDANQRGDVVVKGVPGRCSSFVTADSAAAAARPFGTGSWCR